MPRLNSANFAMTTLVEQILNTAESPLSFEVDDASGFPDAPFKILIHDGTPEFAGVKEIMEVGAINKVTGILSDVTRAQEGTSAQTHAIGAKVECVWTAGTHQELTDNEDFDNHSARHEDTGADEINLTGLQGEPVVFSEKQFGERHYTSTEDKTYYIDEASGSDTNDGETEQTAFASWGKCFSVIPRIIEYPITVEFIGNYSSIVNIEGIITGELQNARAAIHNTPRLRINFNENSIYGCHLYNCLGDVHVDGGDATLSCGVYMSGCHGRIRVDNFLFVDNQDGLGGTTSHAIDILGSSGIDIRDIDVGNEVFINGVNVQNDSHVSLQSIAGNVTSRGIISSQGSVVGVSSISITAGTSVYERNSGGFINPPPTLAVTSTDDATSPTDAPLKTAGGLAVAKSAHIGAVVLNDGQQSYRPNCVVRSGSATNLESGKQIRVPLTLGRGAQLMQVKITSGVASDSAERQATAIKEFSWWNRSNQTIQDKTSAARMLMTYADADIDIEHSGSDYIINLIIKYPTEADGTTLSYSYILVESIGGVLADPTHTIGTPVVENQPE